MKRLLTACAVIGLCISIRVSAQSEVGYRANIGKLAVSAANGTEIGRIVDVVMMNGIWVYKVRHEGKISTSPVETIVAKGVPQGTAKTPSVLTSESNIDPAAGAHRDRIPRGALPARGYAARAPHHPQGHLGAVELGEVPVLRIRADRSAVERQADPDGLAGDHRHAHLPGETPRVYGNG